jgi:hypothetical protein
VTFDNKKSAGEEEGVELRLMMNPVLNTAPEPEYTKETARFSSVPWFFSTHVFLLTPTHKSG